MILLKILVQLGLAWAFFASLACTMEYFWQAEHDDRIPFYIAFPSALTVVLGAGALTVYGTLWLWSA